MRKRRRVLEPWGRLASCCEGALERQELRTEVKVEEAYGAYITLVLRAMSNINTNINTNINHNIINLYSSSTLEPRFQIQTCGTTGHEDSRYPPHNLFEPHPLHVVFDSI